MTDGGRDPGGSRADRWGRISELLEAALGLPVEERAPFLDAACGDDSRLRDEVRSLLRAREGDEGKLESRVERLVIGAAGALISEGGAAVARGLIGSTIGRYEIREWLGQGGMGVVFRAFDDTLGREVALKLLPPHVAEGDARGGLLDEARAVSALDHPNLAVVHEVGATGTEVEPPWSDRFFIVMGYYPGETLQEKIARGPLPIARAVDYAKQIAAGLERAHEAGIVHRDIKPANLIVTERGRLKIIDFGVAGVLGSDKTEGGPTRGTPAYMSPEQTRGERLDARTDIWSLGVVLHEMLAASPPFEGDTAGAMIEAIRGLEPPDVRAIRPDVPEAVARVVRCCLEKDRGRRYPDVRGLRRDLGAALDPAETGERHGHRAIAVLGAVLITAAIVGVWWTALGPGPAGPVSPSNPDQIAVLPLSASEPDSALERLGRDLAITLGATLDGIGDLITADPLTILGQVGRSDDALTRAQAREVAAGLGAGRFVHGALTRSGSGVGIEAQLLGVVDLRPVARISITEATGDVGALSDSIALSILRQLWQDDPLPELPVDRITTRSVPALRAYLEGEQALAGYEMQKAVDSFERSFAYDSTFWFAYWRSLYPRAFGEVTAPPDTGIMRRVVEHVDELPVRDRLLVEAWNEGSARARLERLQSLARRFEFWGPAWYEYANFLTHFGPYLGTTLDQARGAMERAATLNPGFAPAWSHLFWLALSRGDPAAAGEALREFEPLFEAQGVRRVTRLRVERFRHETLSAGLPGGDSLSRTAEWILSTPPPVQTAIATGLVADYMPSRQLTLNAALLANNPSREVAAAARLGNALSWMARGAWDSALVSADRYAAVASGGQGARRAYGIAVVGAALGVVRAEEARNRRPVGQATSDDAPAAAAELAWLDGVSSYVRGDRAGMGRALDRLRGSTARDVPVLRESLEALAADVDGERERAVRLLVDRERRTADSMLFLRLRSSFPLVMPLHRLIAARWLREAGRGAEAESLLTWTDAIGGPEEEAWRRALGVIGLVERGRIAEAAGRRDEARDHYARFVEVVDHPVAALEPLLEQAEAGLARLETESASARR